MQLVNAVTNSQKKTACGESAIGFGHSDVRMCKKRSMMTGGDDARHQFRPGLRQPPAAAGAPTGLHELLDKGQQLYIHRGGDHDGESLQ